MADLHLSTLVQQMLSVIAQHGAVGREPVLGTMRPGPFRNVDHRMFAAVLRAMGATDLIMQPRTGCSSRAHTATGLLNHYTFYAVFHTPVEFGSSRTAPRSAPSQSSGRFAPAAS